MHIFFTAVSFFAASAPAPQGAEPVLVDRDGYRLEYIVSQQDDGSKLISGRDLERGESFSLLVKNRRVRGEVGGRYVSFVAPKVRKATVIASR